MVDACLCADHEYYISGTINCLCVGLHIVDFDVCLWVFSATHTLCPLQFWVKLFTVIMHTVGVT